MWVAQNLLANSEAEINSRAVNCGFLSPKFLPLHPPAVPEDLLHLESQASSLRRPSGKAPGSPPNLAEFQCSSSSLELTFLG